VRNSLISILISISAPSVLFNIVGEELAS